MAAYGSGVVFALEVVSLSGMVSNSVSIWYILKHFNVEKTVFLLLLIDAVVCLSGCCVSFCSGLFMSKFTSPCAITVISIFLANTTGFATMMEISIIRFHSLRLSMRNQMVDETQMKRWALILLFISSCYPIAYFTSFIAAQLPYSVMVESCVSGNPNIIPSVTTVLARLIPCIIMYPVISIILDIVVIWNLKSQPLLAENGENACVSKSFDAIPVRPTLLSTASLMVPLIGAIYLHLSWSSKLTSSVVTLVTEIVVVVVRCPIATFACYTHKNKREFQSKRISRETRLKKVLLYAEREKEMRKMKTQLTHV